MSRVIHRLLPLLTPMSIEQSARAKEIAHNLQGIKDSISKVAPSPSRPPTLVAVSKLKPASDILGCYHSGGHKDFGENYVSELLEKAEELPNDIRWHFIGPLQSNKAKMLASIPNIYAFHTLSTTKVASLLSKHLPNERETPLKVFVQINTSNEDTKNGLMPLSPSATPDARKKLFELCRTVIKDCPGLHLTGLMTIGAFLESSSEGENQDFARLKETRALLEEMLLAEPELGAEKWGEEVEVDGGAEESSTTSTRSRHLLLSMGMSGDFMEAIRQGSDFVRVGSSIFGQRPQKKQEEEGTTSELP